MATNKNVNILVPKALAATLLLILLPLSTIGQDYERVDAIIQLYPKKVKTPEEVSAFISRDFESEDDKLRAIYGWIIQNIAYDPDEYKALDYGYTTIKDRNKKQEAFREQLITRVLQQGDAVCEGYAMLFERLCELQGIRSYLVRGDSKASLADIGRDFKANHMWNIAYIGETPFLFDPTWGAGKYNGKFIKEPSYVFFKTPPEVFLRNHYPVLTEDALLTTLPSQEAFLKAPILIDAAIKSMASLHPNNGVLPSDAPLGLWEFEVAYDSEALVSYGINGQDPKKTEVVYKDGMLLFTVPAVLGAQYLLIFIDQAPAIAYKID